MQDASSKEARAAVDAQLHKVIPQFREDALTKSAPYVNHWLCANLGGNYGASYQQRTTANYAGIWANNPAEVVYFHATPTSSRSTAATAMSCTSRRTVCRSQSSMRIGL